MLHYAVSCTALAGPAKPSKHRVSVNLSSEEYRELEALAKKTRISKAWLGRQPIIKFLDRYRDRDLQLPLDLATPRQSGD
ncbi:ribbon-helix-helix domain-containing protein [Euryhalocaulis caribicus]|uniref:ribbon-helix-helix protein, CopG family n=1 Tax=Euryhalocaulis caribicus TaxID=1161401 RepID=UPI0013771336